MNILFVTINSVYFGKKHGGAESSIKLIAEKMASRGHEINYLTFSQNSSHLLTSQKSLINEVNVTSIGLLEKYKDSRLIAQARTAYLKRKIEEIITSQKIDLVYCFYELDVMQSLFQAKQKHPKLKIVLRMAGLRWYEDCKKEPALIPTYELLFSQFDAVNFIHANLLTLVESKIAELKMNVTFQHKLIGDIGTSSPIGRKINYQDLPLRPFRMIMATRFSDFQKRHDILVKAMALIPAEHDIHLILIGSGVMKDEIQNMIDQLQLSDRVQIIPFFDQASLWQEMQNSHLLCHATEHEGLSKIIIESMANGLPVLASDVQPLNSYIVDGTNGLLVENEPQLWAAKIQQAFADRELLCRLSKNEIDYIRETYDPDRNINIYLTAFQELIARGA